MSWHFARTSARYLSAGWICVVVLVACSVIAADPQIRIDPNAQPKKGTNAKDAVNPSNISNGPPGPNASFSWVEIRTDKPELTFSDTSSGTQTVIRNLAGDLHFSGITPGVTRLPNGRIVDLSAYRDTIVLRSNGSLALVGGGPAWTSNNWKDSMELENGSAFAWRANTAGQRFGMGHTNGGFYFFRTQSDPATNGQPAKYDFVIKDDGAVSVNALEITGADLAENFEVAGSNQMREGFIVSIDPINPGKLLVSDRPYDRRVAGVIAGAGGIGPGVVMGQGNPVANGGYPVALTGRVYCWADASGGAISPGDFLTTSSTPGHAMKVTDYSAAQGAVIGKAMTGLQHGKGFVLVLVTLQ